MGVYSTKQEQGQERTWINLDDYEQFDVHNKDVKDEVFIGHLPVSRYLKNICKNVCFSAKLKQNMSTIYLHAVGSYERFV